MAHQRSNESKGSGSNFDHEYGSPSNLLDLFDRFLVAVDLYTQVSADGMALCVFSKNAAYELSGLRREVSDRLLIEMTRIHKESSDGRGLHYESLRDCRPYFFACELFSGALVLMRSKNEKGRAPGAGLKEVLEDGDLISEQELKDMLQARDILAAHYVPDQPLSRVSAGISSVLCDRAESFETSVFSRLDEGWLVEHRSVRQTYPDYKGMLYLARLLTKKGVSIGVIELEFGQAAKVDDLVEGHPDSGSSTVEIFDAQTSECLQKRLEEIQYKRSQPGADDDALDAEVDQIESFLSKGQGTKGRSRRFNPDVERSRQRVRGALTTALKKIEEKQPALAEHLREGVVGLNSGAPAYKPPGTEKVNWLVSL